MLGPVFSAELLRAGRRGRAHILRWIYAAWLCAQVFYVFDQTHAPPYPGFGTGKPSPTKAAADFGQGLRDLIIGQQFVLVILVAPAFFAGAITDEKTRGTLQNLLAAHVTAADIVLGKLAARGLQVATLALVPLPILAVVGPVAGIPPEFLVALLALTALLLFGLGGISLLASVWTRQTRSAVILTYVALFGGWWLLRTGWLPGDWPSWFDAKRVLDPAVDRVSPGESFRRLGQAAVAWGGLGLITSAVAVWRLRPAYLRQLEARPRRLLTFGRTLRRPRPTRDVLAWKERYIGLRVPLWVGVPVVAALGAGLAGYTFADRPAGMAAYLRIQTLIYLGWGALLLATLVVGVRCSGAITGERERSTWDGLMMTPLTVQEIVRGKLRGILHSTWPYLLAYWFGVAIIASLVEVRTYGLVLLVFAVGVGLATLVIWKAPAWATWAATALVLLVAAGGGPESVLVAAVALGMTWLAMQFLGAVGLYCSARSQSSWRSLLGTVAAGYAGGVALACVASPIGCVGGIVFALVTAAVRETISGGNPNRLNPSFMEFLPVFYPLGIGLVFWLVARSITMAAETAVAKSDRIAPNWVRMIEYDLPRYVPRGTRRRPRR
jgi:ABC-type transport system involved in multi-copper enzyme maturation permease subunit